MRHELHLTVKGLRATLAVLVPLALVGYLVAGRAGAASMLVGAAIVVVNHLLAALSTGWSRTITAGVIAVGYGGFVVRMFVVFSALAALTATAWVHRGLLAAGFCVALAVSLTAECLSYVRRSYVPTWRLEVQR